MVELNKNDYLRGPYDGESFWGGFAGAAGIIGQLDILTEKTKEYDEALRLANQLIDDYQGKYATG